MISKSEEGAQNATEENHAADETRIHGPDLRQLPQTMTSTTFGLYSRHPLGSPESGDSISNRVGRFWVVILFWAPASPLFFRRKSQCGCGRINHLSDPSQSSAVHKRYRQKTPRN